MAVVGFDMRFHYVMAGWEGSAEDSKVLYSALDDNVDPLQIPEGINCIQVVTVYFV